MTKGKSSHVIKQAFCTCTYEQFNVFKCAFFWMSELAFGCLKRFLVVVDYSVMKVKSKLINRWHRWHFSAQPVLRWGTVQCKNSFYQFGNYRCDHYWEPDIILKPGCISPFHFFYFTQHFILFKERLVASLIFGTEPKNEQAWTTESKKVGISGKFVLFGCSCWAGEQS